MLSLCLVSLLSVLDGSDDHLQSLVEKHQKQLDAIVTLELEARVEVSDDRGQNWKLEGTVRWRKDVDRHRFTGARHGNASPFRSQGLSVNRDFYNDRNESRLLNMPDPPVAGSLRPDNQYGQVQASIAGPESGIGTEGPPIWLFLYVDGRHTLPELYRKATKKILLGKVSIDGTELWRLQLEHPEKRHVYHLYLDPARNYALVRREVSNRDNSEIGGVHRVMESKEVKPGVYIPTHVQNRATKEPTIVDVRVLSVKVNEPLAEDAFSFNFPAGARVRNDKTGERYIWGNGTPALTFANQEKFEQWELAQLGYSPGQQTTKFVLINAALLGVLVLSLVLRKRFAQKPLAG